MKKLMLAILLCGPVWAPAVHAQDVAVEAKGFKFMTPLKVVNAIELYSFKDGKGFTGAESVLIQKANFRLNVGAAAVLGSSANVPFVSLETRLSEKFFDIANNELYFGAWVGKQSDQRHEVYGLAASTKLW